jgi:hypothetical protein
MTFALLQHIVVSLVALGAAAVIVRRVSGIVTTSGPQPRCDACPSTASRRQPVQHVPLTVIRSANRR